MADFYKSKKNCNQLYFFTPQGIAEKMLLTGRFFKGKMDDLVSLKIDIDESNSGVGGDPVYVLREIAR
jgi:hypothetical protein